MPCISVGLLARQSDTVFYVLANGWLCMALHKTCRGQHHHSDLSLDRKPSFNTKCNWPASAPATGSCSLRHSSKQPPAVPRSGVLTTTTAAPPVAAFQGAHQCPTNPPGCPDRCVWVHNHWCGLLATSTLVPCTAGCLQPVYPGSVGPAVAHAEEETKGTPRDTRDAHFYNVKTIMTTDVKNSFFFSRNTIQPFSSLHSEIHHLEFF